MTVPLRLVFCASPLDGRAVDPAFAGEAAAAVACGLPCDLLDFEALVDAGSPERAVRRVEASPAPVLAVYRGWMLRPATYAALYAALAARGVRLINDPAAYRHCHYLPEAYPVLAGHTPRTVWLRTGPDVRMDRIMEALAPFGAAPVVLKDFVKSRKHEWAEACFIPSAADAGAVERVVRRFVALQGEDLSEGLVFREYVPLAPLGRHPTSALPLSEEYRVFYLDGRPLYWSDYWETGTPSGPPPLERFDAVAAAVRSRFFTLDVAKRRDGGWLIIEPGDAQVAGLPDRADPLAFYGALRDATTRAAG
jgi:hypothetical protein